MIKNKNFLLTVILPIFVSIIAGVVIIVLNSQSILNTRATATVESEKKTMNQEMNKLKAEKEELTYTAAEYDKSLEENRLLVEEVTALTEDLAGYVSSIESAKATIEELDASIESKTNFNKGLEGITSTEPGATVSYTDKKLNIPNDLKAGRFKAEGNGTLMIYSISGSLQDKKDLSVIDTHSYTFDVTSGQALKIEGTLSITELLE